jgi:uncharacterized protein
MYIRRIIDNELIKWKNSSKRKPILLRGARQVGKTLSVRQLSTHFEYYIEINFELDKKIHTLFEGNLNAIEISNNIAAVFKVPIKASNTLIFFDEIQACTAAIQSLRFFYEQIPDLHVIAAGSLLEFALSQIPSFGVGRIRSMFMYPLSFNEFLSAFGEDQLIELKQKAGPINPLQEIIHDKLKDYLRKFFLIGGMPEVVSSYVEIADFIECNRIVNDLIISYNDDFAKYKIRVPSERIQAVFLSVMMQIGEKFTYSPLQDQYNIKQVKEAIDLLILSGLVVPVVHSNANGIPLGSEANYKKQKMLVLDPGIYLKMLNFNTNEIILTKEFNLVNKGVLAEMFAGLELIKYQSPYEKIGLNYWHRDAKNSNAEIDYLMIRDNIVTPIEVKSGTKGSMQSMYLFLQEKKLEKGIRLSLENFGRYNKIDVYPLYAIDLLMQ